MILGASPLGSTAAQLGAGYPFVDAGVVGRIIDIVGQYLAVLDMTGSYLTTIDVAGSYAPTIDVTGDVRGD